MTLYHKHHPQRKNIKRTDGHDTAVTRARTSTAAKPEDNNNHSNKIAAATTGCKAKRLKLW